MNKKEMIDKLNKVKIYNNLNKNNFNLKNLQLNKITDRISKHLLEKIAEIFPLNPDQIQKEEARNSEKTVGKITETKAPFHIREIHHFIRQQFQKEEKKALESPLNQRFLFRRENPQRSVSNPAAHFLSASFKGIEKQTKHQDKKTEDKIKKFPAFSAEKETIKIEAQTATLQHLNSPKKPAGAMRSDPLKKTFEDRPLSQESPNFSQDNPLFTPKRTGRKNPSKAENLTNVAPVLFPKPERDALLAILKDIQHKVSEKKPSHGITREVRSYVPSAGSDLRAALRQTIK